MNPALSETIRRGHFHRFGQKPVVMAFAPGRVEILGNHTDYNEGFVLSAAIDRGICLAVSPAPDKRCTVQALDLKEEVSFDLPVSSPVKQPHWSNYLRGVINKLSAYGEIQTGFQATFTGDLPIGAGLSSSAALELASALALSRQFGITIPALELAKLCQAAENEFALAQCGLLDQITCLFGQSQALLFTDFRTLDIETVPLPADICFLLADTRVKHSLSGSATADSVYNERRAQCEQAAAFFATVLNHPVKALRDVTLDEWKAFAGRLPSTVARRARHVIEENARVLEGKRVLVTGNVLAFGELMFQSHHSSQVNFENSCPELDSIVAWAKQPPQVLGARLSGGGFGGSAVLMLHPSIADHVSQMLTAHYASAFGKACETRLVRPSSGAHLL